MRKFEVVTGYEDVAKLPTRNDKGSCGYDFYITRNYDTYVKPQETVYFETGIKACFPEDEVLMMYVRSSMGFKQQLVLSNGTGIIDSSYYNNPDNEGHIHIAITNIGNKTQVIPPMAKVAQGIFMKYLTVDDDNPTGTRVGGIGSTGK